MTEPESQPLQAEPTEIDKLKEEIKEAKDKYLRALAENENMRKRLQKEKQEMTQYAVSNLISEFLSPIDHLENALKHALNSSDEIKHWALGFQMILTQFKDVLSMNGVTPIESLNQPFDPHLHEAIEMIESEKPDGTILEECIKGYKMGEKIIRPARVKVSKEADSETKN